MSLGKKKKKTDVLLLNDESSLNWTKIMKVYLTIAVVLELCAKPVFGHSRWACPSPRSSSTAIKTGPCGSDADEFTGEVTAISPGPLTVIFEESIAHTGAPWRISLSGDGQDSDSSDCVLLDHIPHNPESVPNFSDESTWTQYKITIDIPDVSCERCSLHLANPMTDKIGDDGLPTGVGCTDPDGTCDSVYHSCTLPLSINGTSSRNSYTCSPPPSDWPTSWTGDDGVSVDASTPGQYRRESAVWSSTTHFIVDDRVPASYTTQAGSLCVGDGDSNGESSGTSVSSTAISAIFVFMMVLVGLFAIFGVVIIAKFGRPSQRA